MDFELSKPQKLLQATVREFLTRECPPSRVRELMATPTAFDEELWEGITDQGWTGVTVPEIYEGLGLGVVDLAAIAEVMGEFCLPGPFLSHLWAAAVVAGADNDYTERHIESLAEGSRRATVALLEESADWDPASVALEAVRAGDGYRLDGVKLFVSDAATADLLLWVARLEGELAIFGVEQGREGLTVEPLPARDETRKLYRVTLDGVTVPERALVERGEGAEKALAAATREATVAVCAELVGGMQWVLRQTVEYAKSRQQFGRPIGVFQSVQHRCADILLHLESARSATYYAAWAVEEEDPDAGRYVAIAKAYCSDAAREVGNAGIQVHGGIGFTWEHDLQLFYKRAKSNEILFGDATFHRERIARRVIDGKVEL